MKAFNSILMAAILFSTGAHVTPAWAVDPMPDHEAVEKIDKDIAKDKEKLASKKAEVTTARSKFDRDVSQFGKDSPEVKDDRDSLMNLRNDLVDLKVSLYKNMNKKKVAEGHSIETDTSC